MRSTTTKATSRHPRRSGTEKEPHKGVFDYALILDLANDTIMIRDLNDAIVYWNQGAERLYGWSKKEAAGKNVHALLKTTFPKPLNEVFADFLEAGHWEGFLEHSKKDGTRITVASRWTLQRSKENKPAAYLEINNDVTEQRRIEQDLYRAHRELEKRVAERTTELTRSNAMLLEQVRERQRAEEDLRALTLRLISAQEDERGRISRDLHDDLGQILTYVSLDLERAIGTGDVEKKNLLMKKVLQESQNAYQRLRELSSLLRPPVLDDVGLKAAVHTYISEFSQRTGIAADFHFLLEDEQIPDAVVTTIYRILQEALTNVYRHAGAGRVSIFIGFSGSQISLQIQDDGKGFDRKTLVPGQGGGVSGMEERVRLLGGYFTLESTIGKGTRILILIPMNRGSHA